MKKLSWLLVLSMLLGVLAALPAGAEGTYSQSPMLDERVGSGDLPPLEERLPEVPRVTHEILDEYLDYENGNFGGTLRLVTPYVNWDSDAFIGMNENLLTMASANSGDITANIVEDYQVNDEQTEFTFTLRKGLKWSDGEPVTMEDFRFTMEDFLFNEELNPVVSAYMRDGGVGTGDPFTFEVIDDETFKLSFKEPYGGFAVHISIAGWKGYTDMLKPAHYLKPFHKDYAEECHGSEDAYYEFLAPYGEVMSYDDVKAEGIWVNIFNQVDCTNWELVDPTDALTSVYFADAGCTSNFPVLYPWMMVSNENGVVTWERNPYYFKVDGAGQQLPYFDYVTSTLVEDMEMVQLKYMTGEADFARESSTIDNITLYKENEEAANIAVYVTTMHTNPTDVQINVNYGLNTDGTVKDDDASKAWQEMVSDIRFRQALMLSIDAEEILDSVYKGFGEVNPAYDCSYDIDGANALLDEMGAVDIDGDGYRETPSGLPFSWQIWNANDGSDVIPVCELLVEFWGEIGLKVEVYTTESSMLLTSRDANEIPMRVYLIHSTQLWHAQQWYENEPLWTKWIQMGGLSGEIEAGDPNYLEPEEAFKELQLKIEACFTVDPATAVDELVPELNAMSAEHLWIIEPLTNVQQCVLFNSDIGNVPTGGAGIGWNFALEQYFYNHPEEH